MVLVPSLVDLNTCEFGSQYSGALVSRAQNVLFQGLVVVLRLHRLQHEYRRILVLFVRIELLSHTVTVQVVHLRLLHPFDLTHF
mgnify:CR=1 FL=1